MSVEEIDIDFLISLVQERPIIWDKGHEHYNDKFRKANEWVSVCKHLYADYEEFDDTKKNKIGELSTCYSYKLIRIKY
ncbi:unnamed protein product [Acanthoscelides obtectus]|uniref:MADF domain-containing protein n=1 Tax=Acanthoscelides obtectus TaxID=200917 RepID=A0A9P0KBM0_ACAOB|nr:unnamed protein product [Acanthoscelides obtectus]CAK1656006.1 hypothetical protein AOBTE_LOCUS19506 [Acanthoscelides obtectus]